MNYIEVNSSTIKEVAYDYDNHELRVRFHGDREYIYENVPVEVYAKMLEAFSKGKYFHENINGRYNYSRVK